MRSHMWLTLATFLSSFTTVPSGATIEEEAPGRLFMAGAGAGASHALNGTAGGGEAGRVRSRSNGDDGGPLWADLAPAQMLVPCTMRYLPPPISPPLTAVARV